MTPDEAFDLLGTTPDSSREEIRRAYLRRLKDCRPDDDPQAFMRLREAFETVASSEPPKAICGEAVGRKTVAPTRPEPSPVRHLVPPQSQQSREETPEAVANQRTPQPESVRDLLIAILLLQADGDLAQARRSIARFTDMARTHGGEPSVLATSESLSLWAFSRELDALPDDFPAAVRMAIARAVASGTPSAACDLLHELAMSRRSVAARAAKAIRRSTLLSHFYLQSLRGPGSIVVAAAPAIAKLVGFLVLASFWAAFAYLGGSPWRSLPPAGASPSPGPTRLVPQNLLDARRMVEEHCHRGSHPSLCPQAFTYLDQVVAGDCRAAAWSLTDLLEESYDSIVCPDGRDSCITLTRQFVVTYLRPLMHDCRPSEVMSP